MADKAVMDRAIYASGCDLLPQCLCIARPCRQKVILCQLAARKAADTAFQVGGAASQQRRRCDTAAHSQIAAQPGSGCAHTQHTACLCQQRRIVGSGRTVQCSRPLRACQCKNSVCLKTERHAAQGAFQHGRARRIAHECIAQPVGVAVGCAAAPVALRCVADASCILHGRQRARLQHGDAQTVPSFCAIASNSSCVMGQNRMRSPAA